MNLLIRSFYFLFLIFPLLSYQGFRQHKKLTEVQIKNAARDIIISADVCALITIDPEGRPRVREMDPFSPDNNFTVWFGTNPKSRKVAHIRKNPKVTLYYLDSDHSGYVMIHGTEKLIDDAAEKKKKWKPQWQAFYPDWPKGYMLIKVIPEWMEVVSISRGIEGDPVTWEPPSVTFNPKEDH